MKKKLRDLYYYYSFFFKTRKLRKNFPFYNIESIQETAEDIIKNKKSISRFGDGEFRQVLADSDISFQSGSPRLTEMLREVLQSNLPNHIVALPESFLKHSVKLKMQNRFWWLNYINNIGVQISGYLDPNKKYGNSFISRFYLIYDKKDEIPEIISTIKKIWEQKDLLIVEGKFSRLGVGNDLFDNAKSIQRILCPEKDAFAKYDEIINSIKKQATDKLILIALGPAATAMSYDLAKQGFWALDIGHIDLEYMWYLQGTDTKIPVLGRLVNESERQLSLEIPEEFREKYNSSIIEDIS